MMKPHERIIAALDVPTLAEARVLCAALSGRVGLAKVGLELFLSEGAAAVRAVQETGLEVFLDLKLHDIPNTVEHAAKAVGSLGVRMLTVHASGGAAMIAAARRGLDAAGAKDTLLLAVTVLTSLGADDLAAQKIPGSVEDHVLRLAKLAVDAGANGLVCSPREIKAMRALLGTSPALVVPGIRPAGSAAGDQTRIATPRSAVNDGADWLVIGRPLREGGNPQAAAERIALEMAD